MAVLAAAAFCAFGVVADSVPESLSRARAACGELGGALQTRLLAEIADNSFTGAMKVCNAEAPAIANRVSRERGLHIRRTSLKTRSEKNMPAAWERRGLAMLEQQIARGVDPARAEVYEIADNGKGEQEVRYMKAIITGPLCLTCHGMAIDPDVRQEIRALYPGDAATGYEVNELRGAFSVRVPVTD